MEDTADGEDLPMAIDTEDHTGIDPFTSVVTATITDGEFVLTQGKHSDLYNSNL